MDTYDSSVINCLQDYSAEIKSQECKRQVKKYLILASSDIRFDVTLAKACYKDRMKYCGQVPPVRACSYTFAFSCPQPATLCHPSAARGAPTRRHGTLRTRDALLASACKEQIRRCLY